MVDNNKSNIMEKAVLLRLSFSRPGAVRKADMGQIESDADKRRIKAQKVLFVSPQYQAVGSFDSSLSSWVKARALAVDVGFSGVWILPLGLLPSVDQRLQAAQVERADLVERFMSVYESERDEARRTLNGQFRESDYPPSDVVRASFALRWAYIQFGPADGLPPELAERERAKIEEKFSVVASDVSEALRVGLRDLLSHLVERLSPGPDGKKQIFRDSAVENLSEFLALFSARNITGDSDLAELAGKAQAVIANVKPEDLRKSRSIRETVSAGLGEVKAAVDKLIESAPRRRIVFED